MTVIKSNMDCQHSKYFKNVITGTYFFLNETTFFCFHLFVDQLGFFLFSNCSFFISINEEGYGFFFRTPDIGQNTTYIQPGGHYKAKDRHTHLLHRDIFHALII